MDYSGCVHPIGLTSHKVLYFNKINIDKIIF
ncbi:DUF4176 domain-containing protein [Enterococcus mundtii]|nr:DUF4176 domain-containing protein [Enterococcus mundtii]MDB7101684.1 DUF4176 domain-containing protein [Enterococcus mundtii]